MSNNAAKDLLEAMLGFEQWRKTGKTPATTAAYSSAEITALYKGFDRYKEDGSLPHFENGRYVVAPAVDLSGFDQDVLDRVKSNYQSGWGDAYNVLDQIDAARKSTGAMPVSYATKYTDSDMDLYLLSQGLPSYSQFSKYYYDAQDGLAKEAKQKEYSDAVLSAWKGIDTYSGSLDEEKLKAAQEAVAKKYAEDYTKGVTYDDLLKKYAAERQAYAGARSDWEHQRIAIGQQKEYEQYQAQLAEQETAQADSYEKYRKQANFWTMAQHGYREYEQKRKEADAKAKANGFLDTLVSMLPSATSGSMVVTPPTAKKLVSDEVSNQINAMTTDEKNMYYYLLAAQGEEAAEKYRAMLSDTLNQRIGEKNAEGPQGIMPFVAGIEGAYSGAVQALTAPFAVEVPTSSRQYQYQKAREGQSKAGQVASDLMHTVGNMLPSIGLSMVTGGMGLPANVAGGLGAGMLGLSAGGNAYKEALGKGYTQEQAQAYSALVGASEGGLQYFLGGIGALGTKLTSGAIGKAVNKAISMLVKNPEVSSAISNYIASMGSEALEEYLQEVLDPVFRNITAGEDNKIDLTSPEALYSAFLGALMGGLFDAPSLVTDLKSGTGANSGQETAALALPAGQEVLALPEGMETVQGKNAFNEALANVQGNAARQQSIPTLAQNAQTIANAKKLIEDGNKLYSGMITALEAGDTAKFQQLQQQWSQIAGDYSMANEVISQTYAQALPQLYDEMIEALSAGDTAAATKARNAYYAVRRNLGINDEVSAAQLQQDIYQQQSEQAQAFQTARAQDAQLVQEAAQVRDTIQSMGLDQNSAQVVSGAYTAAMRMNTQTALKFGNTIRSAAEQIVEVEADLKISTLELKADLQTSYDAMTAAMQKGDVAAFNAAKSKYMQKVEIAIAKNDAAKIKTANKLKGLRSGVVEAAQGLRAEQEQAIIKQREAAQRGAQRSAQATRTAKGGLGNGGTQNEIVGSELGRSADPGRSVAPLRAEVARSDAAQPRSETGGGGVQRGGGGNSDQAQREITKKPAEAAKAAMRQYLTNKKTADGHPATARFVEQTPPELAEAFGGIKDIAGINIPDVFLYESDDAFGDGWTDNAGIFVRLNGANSPVFTLAHEIAHNLPDINAAGRSVIDAFKGKGISLVDKYAAYRTEHVSSPDEGSVDLARELIADMYGAWMMTDRVDSYNPKEGTFGLSEDVVNDFQRAFWQALISRGTAVTESVQDVTAISDDLKATGDPEYSRVGQEGLLQTLRKRMSRDDALDTIDTINEIKEVGGSVDEEGFVEVYHRTTPEAAEAIKRTGKMTAKEDGLFFSTRPDGQASGYGNAVIKLRIPAERLVLDDIFANEAHLRLPLNNGTRVADVSKYLPGAGATIKPNAPLTLKAQQSTPWNADFPQVMTAVMWNDAYKNDPDRLAGKKGDFEAAKRLARKYVTPQMAWEVKQKYPNAVILPVVDVETAGVNELPAAFGARLAELAGLTLENKIVKINKTGHAQANAIGRLIFRPIFTGEVQTGKTYYVITDDFISLGGTIADLRNYVIQNGGRVAGVVTLGASNEESTVLPPTEQNIRRLEEMGRDELEGILQEYGIANRLEDLTNAEAGVIGKLADRLKGSQTDILHGIRTRFDKEIDGENAKRSGTDQVNQAAPNNGAVFDSNEFSRVTFQIIEGDKEYSYAMPEIKQKKDGTFYADFTIEGEKVHLEDRYKEDLEDEIKARKQESIYKNARRETRQILEVLKLYREKVSVAEYYKRGGGDHEVALALRGMYLSNGMNQGGMINAAELDKLLESVNLWKESRFALGYSLKSPQRLWEDMAEWRDTNQPGARAGNYFEGERLKETYWGFLVDQNAAVELWQRAEAAKIRQAYDGKESTSTLAQMLGEGIITEADVKKAVYGNNGMIVKTENGTFVFTKKWHESGYSLAAISSDGELVVFSDSYRKKQKAAMRAMEEAAQSRVKDSTNQEHLARVRKSYLDALDKAKPTKGSGNINITMNGSTTTATANGMVLLNIVNGTKADVGSVKKLKDALVDFYARVLPAQNGVLTENGYRPIPMRQNYFPHLGRQSSGMQDFVDVVTGEAQKLPTAISGITSTFSPGKVWVSHVLERMGDLTEYDAIRGYTRYLSGASSLIFYTPVIQRYRQLEKYIREYSIGSKNTKFAAFLHDYTNQIANKKADLDRSLEDIAGREVYTVSDALTGAVGASSVAGSFSVGMSNFISLFTSLPGLQQKQILPAVRDTIRNGILSPKDGFIDRIPALTSRFGKNEKILESQLDRVKEKGGKVLYAWFDITDRISSLVIARAKYAEFKGKGYMEEDAVRRTNDYFVKMFADRAKGMAPKLFTSKALRPFLQFQLEAVNQLSHFRDLGRQDIAEQVDEIIHKNNGVVDGVDWEAAENKIKATTPRGIWRKIYYLLMLSLWGVISRAILGRDQTWNPTGMAIDIGTSDEPVKALWETLTDQAPIISMFTGGRVPIAGGVEGITAPIGELLSKGSDKGDAALDLMKGIIGLVPGGSQIKKTTQGVKAFSEGGYYTDTGRLKYPVEQDWGTFFKILLNGPSAAAPKGYDWQKDTLSASRTGMYEKAVEQGIDQMEAYDFLRTMDGDTGAGKLVSIAGFDSDGDKKPDFSPKEMNIMAAVIGVELPEGKTVPQYAKEQADAYIERKRNEKDLDAEKKAQAEAYYESMLIILGMKK